jgi:hypothetical protein
MDLAEDAAELVEKAEQIVTDPKGALVDEIKDRIASRLGEFIDVDGLLDEADLGEETGEAIKILLDAALGSDEPEDWIKDAIDWGASKIIDADSTGDKADIVIAENKNDDANGQPLIVIGVEPPSDDINEGIDLVLPEGEWEIDVIDESGYVDQMVTFITETIQNVVIASTDRKHSQQDNTYSMSAWVSPGNPDPLQGVTVYAIIYPQDPDVEISFEIQGTDGYYNKESHFTDANGQVSFYVPGGAESVVDVITLRIESTGLTRTLTYVF